MNHVDELERELSRSLHTRADRLADAPLSLADVRGRARGITRRRRLTAAAGLAAAAAVLVPSALLLAPGSDDSAPQPAGPSRVEVTPDHARAGGEGLDVSDLPMGAAPVIGYLRLTDGEPTIVRPDGTELGLETDGTPQGYVALLDGRHVVVTIRDDGESQVEVVGPDGTSRAAYPLSMGIAPGPDREQVAWAAPDGTVQVLQAGVDEPRELGSLEGVNPSVVSLAGGDCFEKVPLGGFGGCIVSADVTRADGSSIGWVLSTTGADGPIHEGSGPQDPAVHSVADHTTLGEPGSEEYGAMVAGITEVLIDGTCSGIYGPTGPAGLTEWLVRTCSHRFGSFSPDASRILAWERYGDGIGHGEIGMYDVSSGEPLWARGRTDQGMAFLHSATWEDDDHLLVSAYQDGRWSLVRFGPDGAMERATERVQGEELLAAYVPEIQP